MFNSEVEEFFEYFTTAHVFRDFCASVACSLTEFFVTHVAEVVNAGCVLNSVGHRDTAPWAVEVDFYVTVHEYAGTEDFMCNGAEEVFGEIHHGFVVAVCLVYFQEGEFRVMTGVNPFITEYTTDFVYAFHATNDEALEVEFEGDTHVKVDVQCVVVGDKWTCGCATGDGVEHWGFNFEECAFIKVTTYCGDDFGAQDEGVFNVRIHDQVNVALTIAKLGIGQTMVLFRKWTHGFAEVFKLADFDTEFTAVGNENGTGDAYDVADVSFFEEPVHVFANDVLAGVDLNVTGKVRYVGKAGFPLTAFCHDTACDFNFFTVFDEDIFVLDDFIDVVGDVKAMTKWVYAAFTECVHLFDADVHNLFKTAVCLLIAVRH